jgi:hypothetical protein
MANRERSPPYASLLIPAPPDDGWHPLSGHQAPEWTPDVWIGAHAGLRLTEAFKTLASMPTANGPRFQSGGWPSHPMEWIDIVAKEHEWLNDPGQAREAAQQWARTRHRITPEEVSRMEAALSWAPRYLNQRPLVMRLVQQVAWSRARGIETDKIAHRLHKPAVTVRRINRAGLDAIAAGLRRDDVAVF